MLVNFDISEASYGQTNADWTFSKHTLGRSIFDLAIPFDSLVSILPTIWLTTVKHESLSFFQRNKDPRAYIINRIERIRKIDSVAGGAGDWHVEIKRQPRAKRNTRGYLWFIANYTRL
jgi:hypothetical protein